MSNINLGSACTQHWKHLITYNFKEKLYGTWVTRELVFGHLKQKYDWYKRYNPFLLWQRGCNRRKSESNGPYGNKQVLPTKPFKEYCYMLQTVQHFPIKTTWCTCNRRKSKSNGPYGNKQELPTKPTKKHCYLRGGNVNMTQFQHCHQTGNADIQNTIQKKPIPLHVTMYTHTIKSITNLISHKKPEKGVKGRNVFNFLSWKI